MIRKTLLLLIMAVCANSVTASGNIKRDKTENNPASIEGHVFDEQTKEPIAFANILVKGMQKGTTSDLDGNFILRNLQPATYILKVSFVGYETIEKEVVVSAGKTTHAHIELKTANTLLNPVVVSANRNEINRKEAPTIVNVLSDKAFEASNAHDLSQALPFQTGVRVEYNCQNCGFPQVRINGLEGPYTQLLIDSRAVMSSLAGVYGLEQIPVNMIDRIEVVKGGSSALFGSNAIAGTINIITKEPVSNTFSISTNLESLNGSATSSNINANAAFIRKDKRFGASFYQTFRKRTPFDYDKDGFSELGMLDARSFGTKTFFKMNNLNKLTLEYHTTEEERRGGNAFEQPAHQADICEMTNHKIHTASLTHDYITLNGLNHYSVYSSVQYIDRNSYYGSYKDPNAYGKSDDLTLLFGVQGSNKFAKLLFLPATLTYGAEFNANTLNDKVLGYNISMHQSTQTGGIFLQSEWTSSHFNFLIGGRLDKHNLINDLIFSPRMNILYKPSDNMQFRASYGAGYRPPQAFDEDLHVTQVGGLSLRTHLAQGLRPEYSHSLNLSADLYHSFSRNIEANLLLEGFYTELQDVFALRVIDYDTINSTMVQERYNASGARVAGISLTAKIAYKTFNTLSIGYTHQNNRYRKTEFWSSDETVQGTDKMLRTPDNYGFISLNYQPVTPLELNITGTYTGSMTVPHYAGYIASDCLEQTPDFYDINLSTSYTFNIYRDISLKLTLGIKNMFNAFQQDFDKGIDRDAGYIYGPMQPRTLFIAAKIYSI
ncbi:MAG: TonB-dependent receptor [Bacteroidales bacterium]|jgi:outer membrane receptor for ferrienterochelin and colicins|nr:TonB-dependent receptor [Bacteroidales bacterium]